MYCAGRPISAAGFDGRTDDARELGIKLFKLEIMRIASLSEYQSSADYTQ
jgi:hypothetical protein